MNRRTSLILIGLLAILSVVNATIFTYRWITGTVIVQGPDVAAKYGCVGFYSAATQQNISQYLPNLGTNAVAQILGTGMSLSIEPGDTICGIPSTSQTYNLYESISVVANITVGSWYMQDIYAFGYYNEQSSPNPVYVYIRLEQSNMSSIASTAFLILYKMVGGTYSGPWSLNLTGSAGTMIGPITLPINSSLRIDLYIDAQTTGTATFKIGFYVTPEANESPSLP